MLKRFGESRDLPPERDEAQALVARWQAYITANFYRCTNEILAGLGQMYVGDERFTENIDQNGIGTAAFMARAIEIYCAK
ncbi:MAG: TipAS antibiotic-recognition domain-containing protein [Clostridia bacterium]